MALALNMGRSNTAAGHGGHKLVVWFHFLSDSGFPGRYARMACQYNLKWLRVRNNKEDKDRMQHL